MLFKHINTFFFSGTGNSATVAHWIKETAEQLSIQCNTYNISNLNNKQPIHLDKNDLLIFTSPVHGFNYPPKMIQFLLHFPKGKNKVVLMNTRAGMKIGRFITPGLSGITFYLAALILKIKGYSIQGMIPVDLPSNWISVHPGLNQPTIEYMHQKIKIKVQRNTEILLQGKQRFNALFEIIQDILISPISFLYYFIGRFMIAKTYYASDACTDCGLCVKNCPVNAIKKVHNRLYWTFNCESCMHCMSYCPHKAIETAHGFIIPVIFLFNVLLSSIVYQYINIESKLLEFLFEAGFLLLLLGIAYYIFHLSLKIKFFHQIFLYTSLTHYKWWGRRYKAQNK